MTLKEARRVLTDDKQPAAVCPYCGKDLTETARLLVGVDFSGEVYQHHFFQHKLDAVRAVVAVIRDFSDDQLDSLEALRGRR